MMVCSIQTLITAIKGALLVNIDIKKIHNIKKRKYNINDQNMILKEKIQKEDKGLFEIESVAN